MIPPLHFRTPAVDQLCMIGWEPLLEFIGTH
jgi:hypothetical protein